MTGISRKAAPAGTMVYSAIYWTIDYGLADVNRKKYVPLSDRLETRAMWYIGDTAQ
jgi:hypothetical protein